MHPISLATLAAADLGVWTHVFATINHITNLLG